MPTAPCSSSKSLYCCCGYLCCFFPWAPPGFWFISVQFWGLVRKWGQCCRFGLRSVPNNQKFIFSLKMNWNLQLMTNLSDQSWHLVSFFPDFMAPSVVFYCFNLALVIYQKKCIETILQREHLLNRLQFSHLDFHPENISCDGNKYDTCGWQWWIWALLSIRFRYTALSCLRVWEQMSHSLILS